MAEGMIAGLESTDVTIGEAIKRMQKSIVEEYEKQERKENMNIEDCKTVYEYFGVKNGEYIYVEGKKCQVWKDKIVVLDVAKDGYHADGRALVGCLTGQLKWSRTEPMSEDEEKIVREIAAWHPQVTKLKIKSRLLGSCTVRILAEHGYCEGYHLDLFGDKSYGSKAYTVLAPILEKYGEINLDEFREESK